MMQPVIAPLFKTRPFEDSLLTWSGSKISYDNYFKQYWTSKLGGHEGYEKALQDGVVDHISATTPISQCHCDLLKREMYLQLLTAISSMKKGGTS